VLVGVDQVVGQWGPTEHIFAYELFDKLLKGLVAKQPQEEHGRTRQTQEQILEYDQVDFIAERHAYEQRKNKWELYCALENR
jgi:hypothetical protein